MAKDELCFRTLWPIIHGRMDSLHRRKFSDLWVPKNSPVRQHSQCISVVVRAGAPARVSHTCHRLMSWREGEDKRGRGPQEWEGTRLAVRSRPEKTRRVQRKSSLLKADGSGGTRAAGRRAQMAGNTHQCQSVKGDWSVCETDPPYLPPLPVWGGGYVTGSWRGPSVLCPRAVMIDFRGGAPYLPLSCLPAAAYQPHTVQPDASEGGSACSEGSRPRVTGWQPKPLKSGVRSARGAQAAAPHPTRCFTSCVWCGELFTLDSCPRRKTEQPRSAVQYAEMWTRWGDFTSSVGRLQGSLSDL